MKKSFNVQLYECTQSEFNTSTKVLKKNQLIRYGNSHKLGNGTAQIKDLPIWGGGSGRGTERQVMGYNSDGEPIARVINIEHLTDIGGFPSFQNGILTATAMNATNKTGLLSFIEMSNGGWKPSTIPIYNSQGGLSVGDPVQSSDAVPLLYFNQRIPQPPDGIGTFKLISNGGNVSWAEDV